MRGINLEQDKHTDKVVFKTLIHSSALHKACVCVLECMYGTWHTLSKASCNVTSGRMSRSVKQNINISNSTYFVVCTRNSTCFVVCAREQDVALCEAKYKHGKTQHGLWCVCKTQHVLWYVRKSQHVLWCVHESQMSRSAYHKSI